VSALSGAAASLVVEGGESGEVALAAANLRAMAAAAATIRSTLGDGHFTATPRTWQARRSAPPPAFWSNLRRPGGRA